MSNDIHVLGTRIDVAFGLACALAAKYLTEEEVETVIKGLTMRHDKAERGIVEPFYQRHLTIIQTMREAYRD